MAKYIIQGGTKLEGEINVKGAKNLALKILPASLLSAEKITILNFPDIEDIDKEIEIIKDLGGTVEKSNSRLKIQTKTLKNIKLKTDIANKFRASIMFTGPLLARAKEVMFSHPGGCVIGAGDRPIDLFLDGFKNFGVEIAYKNNQYHLKTSKLRGCQYFFTNISVTGTECLMMTAVLAEGKTILKNCAMEPEIKYLADYLNSQGAKINGAGTSTIAIEGVNKIKAGKFKIIPDRIEAGTFAILAAATKSNLTIKDCNPDHMQILLNIFSKSKIKYETGKDWLKIKKSNIILPYSIKTHEYPGFPTDLQAPYTVLMTQARGSSLIFETIFDRRLLYTDMLIQMGADIIMCDPHRVVVNGPTKLYGKRLTSPDLRAGISLLIAALIAKGETEIDNIYQIERGYEKIDTRLNNLGAKIKRIE